jgi:hypothetical protein
MVMSDKIESKVVVITGTIPMSALGQNQTSRTQFPMSALSPKADIAAIHAITWSTRTIPPRFG